MKTQLVAVSLLVIIVAVSGQTAWQSVDGNNINFKPTDGCYYAMVTERNHLLNARFIDGGIERIGFKYTNEVEAVIRAGRKGNFLVEVNNRNFSTGYGHVRMYLLEGRVSFEMENSQDPTYRHYYFGDLPSTTLTITTPDLVIRISQPINSQHLSLHVGTHPIHVLQCHGVLGQFFTWSDSSASQQQGVIEGDSSHYAVSWLFGTDSVYNKFVQHIPEIQDLKKPELSQPSAIRKFEIAAEQGGAIPRADPEEALVQMMPEPEPELQPERSSGNQKATLGEVDMQSGLSKHFVANAELIKRVNQGLAQAAAESNVASIRVEAQQLTNEIIDQLQSGRAVTAGVWTVHRQNRIPTKTLFQGLSRHLKLHQEPAGDGVTTQGIDAA